MTKLSVFLITKNEESDLPGCLEALKGLADEIVVVDSGSTDRTLEIARQAGARVLTRGLDGFAAQKQFALDHCAGDWLLSIDADERVTPALAKEIRETLSRPEALAGYSIKREMFFLGKRLRHGGVGTDWVTRLFRKGMGRYRPVSVHESIEIEGESGQLRGCLQHYSYATLEEYNQKCDHYTTLAANDLFKKGRRFHQFDHLRPVWELFSRVVLRGAWLDGQPGLIYAALSAHAAWLRAIKLWQLEKMK